MFDRLTDQEQKIIRNHQETIPVHMVSIANDFGLTVYKNKNFPDEISGLIKRNESGSYEIHVNGNHAITRRRFTIAHELAHFLLHKEEIGDGITDDFLYRSKRLSSAKEVEANNLAADILMPRDKLIGAPYRSMTISEQADRFWVSRISMDIRLGKLLK